MFFFSFLKAQNAERQADVVVQNLLHCDSNNPIATYEPKPRPIIISLGLNIILILFL